MLGMPAEVADEKLLKGMWDMKSPFLPLFVAVFEAKRYFEAEFGSDYTSSLYYFPEKHKSLIFTLADESSYDNIDTYSTQFTRGRELEKRWKSILFNVWQGFCYSKSLPEVTTLVRI